MSAELELRQTVAALEGARAQMLDLTKQQQLVSASIEEYVRARETLTGYSGRQEGESILIPVGAEIFLHARAAARKEGIMNIGGGIMMERPLAEISEIVNQRLTELQKLADEIAAQAERLTASIEGLTHKAQTQYSNLQGRASGRERERIE